MESFDKDTVILENIPLVKKIASNIYINDELGLDYEDIIGYGILGLIEAIDKYDSSKNVKFSTYAFQRIKGAILDEIRKKSPLTYKKVIDINNYNDTIEKLQNKHLRDISLKEISDEMKISQKEVLEIKNNIQFLSKQDIDPILQYIEDKSLEAIIDYVVKKELNNLLLNSIYSLKEKERDTILLRYYEGFTFSRISKTLSISESRVFQLHKNAILKLEKIIKNYYKEV